MSTFKTDDLDTEKQSIFMFFSHHVQQVETCVMPPKNIVEKQLAINSGSKYAGVIHSTSVSL